MRRKTALGILFLSLWVGVTWGGNLTSGVAQEVMWVSESPIHWEFFLAPPPPDAAARTEAAAIHMTIRWSLAYVVAYDARTRSWKGTIDRSTIEVTNTMEPFLSWVVPGKESADILNHEQRHFDLNEVYRRKLLAALEQISAQHESAEETKAALKQEIDATVQKILDKLKEMQEIYDVETAHGSDRTGQTTWDERIDAWLANPNQAPI
jgi:hypothetical protein